MTKNAQKICRNAQMNAERNLTSNLFFFSFHPFSASHSVDVLMNDTLADNQTIKTKMKYAFFFYLLFSIIIINCALCEQIKAPCAHFFLCFSFSFQLLNIDNFFNFNLLIFQKTAIPSHSFPWPAPFPSPFCNLSSACYLFTQTKENSNLLPSEIKNCALVESPSRWMNSIHGATDISLTFCLLLLGDFE